MTDAVEQVALSPEEEARRAELRARMQKGQEKMRELRASGWKPVVLNPVERAKANPNSLKAAIKAACWVCVGTDADPGAKFRVRDCAVGEKCPLYPHRPWQAIKGGVSISYDETGAEVVEGADDESDDE